MGTQSNSNSNDFKKGTTITNYPATSITETIVNGLFTIDREWTVLDWNKSAEKITGVSEKDIIGKNLWKELLGNVPPRFYDMYEQAFQPHFPVHFNDYWSGPGAWFDFITFHFDGLLTVSFKSSEGETDPASSKDWRDQGDVINELYRFITEVTNDCLWEWDFTAKEIFWIDGGHKRVFGYPVVNALVPQRFWEGCIHPDDKERVLAGIKNMKEQGSENVWEEEYRFKNAAGGYIYVHVRGLIVYRNGKPIRMIGASQDISVRKLTEHKLLQEIVNNQQEITKAVLAAQENERAEIGKELHDNLNQILSATKLYIEMAKSDPTFRLIYLDKCAGFLTKVIEEIRRISKNLLPPALHFMDLVESVKGFLDDLSVVHAIKIEFDSEYFNIADLNGKLELNIFRIVQEQVTNILKHSNATHAVINLSTQEESIILSITDNGKGFDMTKNTTGVGLRNIMSRAELFHGKVTITSAPGAGCILKAAFPIDAP